MFVIGKDSSFWASYAFIIEHLLVIGLLLLVKNKCESSFGIALVWAAIVHRIELIIFNIILIHLPIEQYKAAKHCNLAIQISLASIFFLIVFAKHFDKIIVFLYKILKWIRP